MAKQKNWRCLLEQEKQEKIRSLKFEAENVDFESSHILRIFSHSDFEFRKISFCFDPAL